MKIFIYSIFGSSGFISDKDGDIILNKIKYLIDNDKFIELSFLNCKHITTTFIDHSICHLYKYFTKQTIKKHLSIIDICNQDLLLIKICIQNAKKFYNCIDT